MSDNNLSANDLDALMSGDQSEVSDELASQGNGDNFQACDIATQQRIIREKLPTLASINERFAGTLQNSLLTLLRKPSDVVANAVLFQAFHELQFAIQSPAYVSTLTLTPLLGSGLVVCEAPLVFALVDTLFGGQSQNLPTKPRDFSATEQSVVQRLISVVIEHYQNAWSSVYPLTLRYQDSVSDINLVRIASASEVMVCSTFTIEVGKLTGSFHICFPYASLAPIRDVLMTAVFPKSEQPDTDWSEKMSQQIELAEIEIVANFAQVNSSVRELLALEKGQILQCVIEKNVIATVCEVPLLSCRFGSKNGRIALKVNHFLNDPSPIFESM